jgi:hypothetical protein
LTFNNWSSGETNSELLLDMNHDYEFDGLLQRGGFFAGWIFIFRHSGRIADFASEGNSASTLILRKRRG